MRNSLPMGSGALAAHQAEGGCKTMSGTQRADHQVQSASGSPCSNCLKALTRFVQHIEQGQAQAAAPISREKSTALVRR